MNLTGIYLEKTTNAIYYVHQFKLKRGSTEKDVLGWFGEYRNSPRTLVKFASVFFGETSGVDKFKGTEWDVPKGVRTLTNILDVVGSVVGGKLQLTVSGSGRPALVFKEIAVRSASRWKELAKTTTVPSGLEHGAGFYNDTELLSLTGVWKSWPNKGDAAHENAQLAEYGMYYVRHLDKQVVAFGEHENTDPSLSWSSVFIGTTNGEAKNRQIDGFWFDVPKATRPLLHGTWSGQSRAAQTSFSGELASLSEVEIKSSETVSPNDRTRPGKNAAWVKTDSVRVNFNYRNVTIREKADDGSIASPGGGDEPYVIPFFFAITGETLDAYRILATNAGTDGVLFDSSLENPDFQTGDWPKNNLTWQEDLGTGTTLTIPDFEGYNESVIRPIWGLQPNTEPARKSARYVAGLILLEEQHSINESVRKPYWNFRDESKSQLNGLLTNVDYGFNSTADVEGWLSRIVNPNPTPPTGTTITSIINTTLLQEEVTTDTSGHTTRKATGFKQGDYVGTPFLSLPDRVLGVSVKLFTFEELRRLALGERVANFPLSFNTHSSEYLVSASMYVNLSADLPVQTVSELELSLFTQGDDKREGDRGSVVRVQVSDSSDRNLLPTPWVFGQRGEKFENWSFKNGRRLISPVLNSPQLKNLKVDFEQGRRGDLPWEEADKWKLNGVRLAVFDAFGKRHLLVNNYPGYYHHFTASETLPFPLP